MLIKIEQTNWIQKQIDDLRKRLYDHCGVEFNIQINSAKNVAILSAEVVIDVVCAALKVNKIALFGQNRNEDVLFARYICIRLIRVKIHLHDTKVLGSIFNKDRTTIINAIQVTENLIDTGNEKFLAMLSIAETAINQQSAEI